MRRWKSMGGGPVGTCAAGRVGAVGGGAALNEGRALGRDCGFGAQVEFPRPQLLLDCGIGLGGCAKAPGPPALPGCRLVLRDDPSSLMRLSIWGLPTSEIASATLSWPILRALIPGAALFFAILTLEWIGQP